MYAITALLVTVPSVTQEAARDLVRAREDVRGDLMRARHRVSKLLLRQLIVWTGGQAWTGRHDVAAVATGVVIYSRSDRPPTWMRWQRALWLERKQRKPRRLHTQGRLGG